MPAVESFECSRCRHRLPADSRHAVCPECAGLLLVRYSSAALAGAPKPAPNTPSSAARYAALLPDVAPVTLGESWTPLLPSRRRPNVWIREEAANPTASLHARGMSIAVAMARSTGFREVAIASSGEAAIALSAYAAAAGLHAHIFMPRTADLTMQPECAALGASITLMDGTWSDCARVLAEHHDGWLDLTAPRAPFRIEGYKTLACEIVEQLGWQYPHAVLCPVGDGLPLIALWKAFEEMELMGWIAGRRPGIIAVHAIPPLASDQSASYASELISGIIHDSGGRSVEISEDEMQAALLDRARHEGLLLSPEGARAAAAYDHLLDVGFLSGKDRVILINPASPARHASVLAKAAGLAPADSKQYPQRTPVGGIITPQ